MKIQQVKITELKNAPYNPRKWSEEAIENLKNSIQEFGMVDPLIVNYAPERKGIIIGGHFRLKIAKDLGYKEVPVVYVNIPDETKERKLNLRLNKNLGEWDDKLLAEFDEDLLSEVGFSSEELDKIFELETSEDDFDAQAEYEKIGKPKTKLGDLWQLGEHKVLCGDSTQKDAVARLLGGNKADMVFTDPPYNVDYSGRGKNTANYK